MKKTAGEWLTVEKHLNIVLEKISEGVIAITFDGKIIYANATALSFFNLSEEKLLGSNLVELFAGDDCQRVLRLLRETGKQPKILTSDSSLSLNEYRVKLKILSIDNDGLTHLIILNDVTEQERAEEMLQKAHDELEQRIDERTAELVKANEDLRQQIKERKRTEEALRESEAQKKAILDASVDRIRLVDTDMRIIWANKTTTRELNMAPEDLVGQPCYRVFFDNDAPCALCPSKKAANSGNIEHNIIHHQNSKGIEGETYWDNYSVPIKNESGDIVNLIQIARNITEQVQGGASPERKRDRAGDQS